MVAVVIVAAPAVAVTAFASTVHIHNHRGVVASQIGGGVFLGFLVTGIVDVVLIFKAVELDAILRDIFQLTTVALRDERNFTKR